MWSGFWGGSEDMLPVFFHGERRGKSRYFFLYVRIASRDFSSGASRALDFLLGVFLFISEGGSEGGHGGCSGAPLPPSPLCK